MAASNEDVTSSAWMAEAKNDPQIEHLLNEVGRSVLGEQPDWYTDPARLTKLADALGPQSSLMFQLREVTNRQEQLEWLAMVLATTQAPQETYAEQETQAAGSGRYSVPVYDENYQLYYRFDNEASVYEWCADPHALSSEWMSQSAADAMVAQGASRHAAAAHENPEVASGQGVTGRDAEPTWAWDDGWGMFYRVGASGVYEYSHSADDAHSRPSGVWLSGEQVLQQRAESARAGQSEHVAVPGEAAHGEHGEGARADGGPGEGSSGSVAAQPLDLESALAVFEQAGVPELREVVEDIEDLFAELQRMGVA